MILMPDRGPKVARGPTVARVVPFEYDDPVTGDKIAASVSPYYSKITVNRREYFFCREIGEFDGAATIEHIGCSTLGEEKTMNHAGPDALDRLEPILVELRKLPGLTEKKRGTFYRRSSASVGRHQLEGFIHFHEDPAGFFADVNIEGVFARYPVNTKREEAALLKTAAAALKDG